MNLGRMKTVALKLQTIFEAELPTFIVFPAPQPSGPGKNSGCVNAYNQRRLFSSSCVCFFFKTALVLAKSAKSAFATEE